MGEKVTSWAGRNRKHTLGFNIKRRRKQGQTALFSSALCVEILNTYSVQPLHGTVDCKPFCLGEVERQGLTS